MDAPLSERPADRLLQVEHSLTKALRTIPLHDFSAMQRGLPVFRKFLVEMAQQISGESVQENLHGLIAAQWPSCLSLLKYLLIEGDEPLLDALARDAEVGYQAGPSDPAFARSFLLARLLLKPHAIAHTYSLDQVPGDWLPAILGFQLEFVPFSDVGTGPKLIAHMERVIDQIVGFLRTKAPPSDKAKAISAFSSAFPHHFFGLADASVRRIMEGRYAIQKYTCTAFLNAAPLHWAPPPRKPGAKIKLGVCVKTMMAGVETWAALANISGLDREKYEIILFCFDYNIGYSHDISFYRELLDKVDDIVSVPTGDVRSGVAFFRSYELDLLLHETHLGLTESSNAALVFIHRLARVQIADFAMHAFTTGNPFYQFALGIEPLFPPKSWEGFYSEVEICRPGIHIYIPETWKDPPNIDVTREVLNIPKDAVVYFASAAAAKYSTDLLVTWFEIVKKVPNAYLVLCPSNPAWAPGIANIVAFHAILRKALALTGVDAARIRILPHINVRAIENMYGWGHIYLSSFPYGGVTSLTDSLRGGLCPVSVALTSSHGCGEAPILAAYGLLDLMTQSPEAYIDLAVRFGTDAAFREKTKARVQAAWAEKHADFRAHLSLTRAEMIDEIVERSFGDEGRAEDQACCAFATAATKSG